MLSLAFLPMRSFYKIRFFYILPDFCLRVNLFIALCD
jgi:hypothetical protein